MKLFEFFSVPAIDQSKEQDHSKDSRAEREKLANDVFWYILDHDNLHKKHFIPIAREMYQQVKAKKSIDRKKYTECWLPMVREGCLSYYSENKMKGNPKNIFDKEFCKGLCERLAERHIKDISDDAYNLGD